MSQLLNVTIEAVIPYSHVQLHEGGSSVLPYRIMTSYIKETAMLVSNLPALQYYIGAQTLPYKDYDLIDYANLRLALFGFVAVYSDDIPKTLAEIFQIVFREI